MQYSDYKLELEGISELSAINPSFELIRSGDISDPVARIAERRERYLAKIRIIEEAARKCSRHEDMQKAVFLAATSPDNPTYEQLYRSGKCYWSRDAYFLARKKFYWHLDKLKTDTLERDYKA